MLVFETVTQIGAHSPLATFGRLRRVCRSWAKLSLFEFALVQPLVLFNALWKAPARLWLSEDGYLILERLASLDIPRAAVFEQFCRASRGGASMFLRFLATRLCAMNKPTCADVDSRGFFAAARSGNTRMLEFFMNNSCSKCTTIRGQNHAALFHLAAENGHAAVIEFLADRCGAPDAACITRADCKRAFYAAAMRGHAAVLEVLAKKFGLGPKDARAGNNRSLYAAAKGGHVAVLRCLAERFRLGPRDACAGKNRALLEAIQRDDTKVVKCLVEQFHLKAAYIRADIDAIVRTAVANERWHLLNYLHQLFQQEVGLAIAARAA